MADLNDRGFNVSSKTGDVGEAAYAKSLELAKSAGTIASYIDLTKNGQARHDDCDFVVFMKLNGNREYTEQEAEWILKNERTHPDYCRFIEIKTDKVILGSGNVYLEWIAHDLPGCFAITKADNWIYYGVDETENIVKCWSIDIRKLRHLLTTAIINPKNSSISIYPDVKNGNYGYRIKIDTLIHFEVAKEIKL